MDLNEIPKYLNLLEWSVEQLAKHLDTVYKRKLRDRERHRKYVAKNRDKVYAYHRQWRQKNPKTKKNGEKQNTETNQLSFPFKEV